MTNPSTTRPAASTLAVWVGLLTLYFVWGSTYIGIKVAVESIPAFIMGSARFLLAGSLLLGWSLLRDGPSALRVTRIELGDSFVVGSLLLGGGMGMVALGEQTVPAGITALLIALMPLWVAVLGRVVFGEQTSRLVLAGIVIGLVGVVILVAPTSAGLAFSAGGLAAVLLSPISWASGSLYSSHRARLPRLPLMATALQMLFGGLVLGVLATLTGEFQSFSLSAVSDRSLVAFAYLVLVGSGIAYTTYVWMLRVAPLPKIATYAYVNPIVAFVLGAILLGEEISARTVVAAVVIVASVAIIVTGRGRAARGHDTTASIGVGGPALERPIHAPALPGVRPALPASAPAAPATASAAAPASASSVAPAAPPAPASPAAAAPASPTT